MAVRPASTATRLAVERARSRLRGFAPESVEVVELTRGRPFVVVRTAAEVLLVLDERGRLVRGRDRLGAVARHLDLVVRVRATVEEARLDRRREHVEHSIDLLGGHRRAFRTSSTGRCVSAVLESLGALGGSLEIVRLELERQRSAPPTERTLLRTIGLLNEAAVADRAVVLAARRLAAELGRAEEVPTPQRASVRTLRRWTVARLASPDLPFFYAELHEPEGQRFVEAFVAAGRA